MNNEQNNHNNDNKEMNKETKRMGEENKAALEDNKNTLNQLGDVIINVEKSLIKQQKLFNSLLLFFAMALSVIVVAIILLLLAIHTNNLSVKEIDSYIHDIIEENIPHRDIDREAALVSIENNEIIRDMNKTNSEILEVLNRISNNTAD